MTVSGAHFSEKWDWDTVAYSDADRRISRRQLLAATTMLATAFVCADVLAERP